MIILLNVLNKMDITNESLLYRVQFCLAETLAVRKRCLLDIDITAYTVVSTFE